MEAGAAAAPVPAAASSAPVPSASAGQGESVAAVPGPSTPTSTATDCISGGNDKFPAALIRQISKTTYWKVRVWLAAAGVGWPDGAACVSKAQR